MLDDRLSFNISKIEQKNIYLNYFVESISLDYKLDDSQENVWQLFHNWHSAFSDTRQLHFSIVSLEVSIVRN